MAIISTGTLAKALRPGVNQWFGEMYARYPAQYSQIFETAPSSMNYEEDVGLSGFGMAVIRPESQGVQYDTMGQGFKARYINKTVGLGFIISRDAIEDNQYMSLAQSRTKALALSMAITKETMAANVLNRAFSNSYPGADGLELCSSVHLNVRGGTYRNELATPADLSEESLEQAIIDISRYTDDAGLQMSAKAMKLIIPPDLQFVASRILGSDQQNNTVNNAINALKVGGFLPQGYCVNHYLTDTDAWFLITDVPYGLRHFQRRDIEIDNDTDFDSDNMRFKATERYCFGWTDPKGVFGSEGAA